MADDASMVMELLDCPADERRARLAAMGDFEQAIRALVDQTIRLTMVNARTAMDAAALVVTLADDFGSPLMQAQARRAQVRAMSYAGHYEEALIAAQEGVAVAQSADLIDEAGRTRLATMHALTEAGRLDEALHFGELARSTFLSTGNDALAARADVNLGIVHQRRDEPDEAVACFGRAAPALKDEPLSLGHLENSRGEALLALNDFLGAEQAFTAALAAFEQADAELTAAIAQGNLADLAMRQGRFSTALTLFERARRRFESIGSPGHLARLVAEQAEAKALIGMNEDALRDYQQALQQLDARKMPLEAARARGGMGQVLIRLGRLSQAETALAAAATGFAELGHQTARARVNLHRAELAAAGGRLREAREMALRSLSVLDTRPVDAIAARRVLAALSLQSGETDLAEAELAAAIATAERYELTPLMADLLVLRGDLFAATTGRTDLAIESWRAAMDAVERVRGTFQAMRFRTAFLGQRTAAYERLVEALLVRDAEGDRAEAFGVTERCKCRSLSEHDPSRDAAADARSARRDEAEDRIETERQRLNAELNGLYSRLADDRATRFSADAYERLLQRVREKEQTLRDCELRVESLQREMDVSSFPVSAAEVQQRLQPGEALLEYFVIDGSLVLFVITPDSLAVARPASLAAPDAVGAIGESLRRLQFQVDRALRPGALDGGRAARLIGDAQYELGALYEAIFKPAEPFLTDVNRLVIVPHGPIHGVPFAALFDGTSYLLDRFDLRTMPNASLAARRPRRSDRCDSSPFPLTPSRSSPSHEKMRRALIVAVGDDDAPQIEREAKHVAESLSAAFPEIEARVILGCDARVDRILDEIEEADLLHFACHGEFTASVPYGSGLKLADRWLTARDVIGCRLHARLVVLSACESGRSAVEGGDELAGLLRAFLGAGAGSLLVSHWRAHDQSSLEFMRILYKRCHTCSSEHDIFEHAVRHAQIELRDRYPHPAYWAAFQLTGGER